MTALEQACPGAVRRIAADAGLEDDMFESVSGLSLPETLGADPTNLVSIWRRT